MYRDCVKMTYSLVCNIYNSEVNCKTNSSRLIVLCLMLLLVLVLLFLLLLFLKCKIVVSCVVTFKFDFFTSKFESQPLSYMYLYSVSKDSLEKNHLK